MLTMTESNSGRPVKFVPFSSAVSSPFWVKYCQEKLETIQLSEEPVPIVASYSVDGSYSRLELQENSLQDASAVPNERVSVKGSLFGFNTLDGFQKLDKNKILSEQFCPRFLQGDIDCLVSTTLITYADLKNHKILYWFGVPALLTKNGKSITVYQQDTISEIWSEEECKVLASQIDTMRRDCFNDGFETLPPFFIRSLKSCRRFTKESFQQMSSESDDIMFGFFDPTASSTVQGEQAMGWPMRNLIAFLSIHLGLGGHRVRILSYRPKRVRRIATDEGVVDVVAIEGNSVDQSILLSVLVPQKEDYEWECSGDQKYKVVGWELNARAKPGPRWVDLRPLLDSHHLAIQAADLNLKLMKWRMIPELQVDKLQSTRALLIGAGTLGCSVARVLLGWGIRKFIILDNGKVSYSNPVRQSLFTLDDCQGESGSGRFKAVAAAESLKNIAADVESEGVVLSIPMPGHSEKPETIKEAVQTLDRLVRDSDVVFLLTDTRESRWLPTVIAAAHNKLMINAALGLDSWLVMRHGGDASDLCDRLGCYFCNDIVAPENSTRNRTLDQQCTVSRPGLAPLASSMAVEMMVSLLHHPDGIRASAPAGLSSLFTPSVSAQDKAVGPLGIVPHQIRGSLVSFTMMTPTVPAFRHCTGCSACVIDAYLKDPIDTVTKTCESSDGSYLEDLSGLRAFRAEAAERVVDMDAWDEDDDNDM